MPEQIPFNEQSLDNNFSLENESYSVELINHSSNPISLRLSEALGEAQ